ncbi:MAG: hypothetical protein JWQ81_3276 [Amycolatopsis sp.]|nr:hypothetical protein [Amycolatopsis sp.]
MALMELSTWTRRLTITCCGAAVSVLALAPIASAQTTATPAPPTTSTTPTSTPVGPITLSPEESQQVCGDWVPKLTARTEKLTARINGGPEVAGSVANLKARAADQTAKGHTAAADRLTKRADKRAGRISDVNAAKQKLDAFNAAHCKAAK